jgi:hypothetical protein
MMQFYKPEKTVSGPSYGLWFKVLATVLSLGVAIYAASIALRTPEMEFGFGAISLLIGAALMFGVSYYWFIRSRITIDENGITQTWLINRHVPWREVSSAKMIGIPHASWLFPPRLVVRTPSSISTFHGGSRDVLLEFAKISLAFQMKHPKKAA